MAAAAPQLNCFDFALLYFRFHTYVHSYTYKYKCRGLPKHTHAHTYVWTCGELSIFICLTLEYKHQFMPTRTYRHICFRLSALAEKYSLHFSISVFNKLSCNLFMRLAANGGWVYVCVCVNWATNPAASIYSHSYPNFMQSNSRGGELLWGQRRLPANTHLARARPELADERA